MTGYDLDDLELIPSKRKRLFFSPQRLRLTEPPYLMGNMVPFPWGKVTGHESEHSPPSSAGIHDPFPLG